MTTTLQLALLGKPEISLAGVPLARLKYQKSLALLVYLAVTGRPHSREALAGLLWGESTEANARASLRKSLAELRARVGDHLIIERRQVAFNREAAYSLDVEDFEAPIERFRTRTGADLHPEEAGALALALDAYQGDFLAGFYVRRAAAFKEWAALHRERFWLMALRGLHTLANHYLTRGDYPQAIGHIERLLALEPYQEEAHRQLISLLALDGRRGAALRQYETCRRLLRAELGIEPQAETTALYHRIKDQSAPDAQPRGQHRPLPLPLTPLLGREEEIARIETRLAGPACRLLTVLGPGGCGKTHLALAVGVRFIQAGSELFEDGITFIPLNSLRSLDALPAAFMHHLGFHFHKDSPPIQQLRKQLAPQRRLLILDNFEHLLAPPQAPPILRQRSGQAPGGTEGGVGVALLPQLLQSAPGVKILITSRVRLNIQGEQVLPLDGIEVPPEGERAGVQRGCIPGGGTLRPARPAGGPNVRPRPGLPGRVARICRQVAGLPLVILLAAGWSGLLSPADIAARLAADAGEADTGIDLLETAGGDLPPRHHSLRRVFGHSWNLLNPQERAALAALALFPGSFTLAAAQEIGGARLRDLRALVDHSLMQREASGRYQLHEITRQFARQKITDPAGLRARYCACYASRLGQWAAKIQGAGQLSAIQSLDLEIDNARRAWDWAVDRGGIPLLDQAMDGLCLYYDWRNRYPEGYTACEALITRLDDPEALETTWSRAEANRLRAKALTWQSVFAPTDQNESLLRRALTCLDDPATDPAASQRERAFCLSHLAGVVSFAGDTGTGNAMYSRSIELYEALEDHWGLANTLNALGEQLWAFSAYEDSAACFQRSLEIYTGSGNKRGSATALMWLGTLALFQGQIEGEALIRKSLARYTDLGNRVSMSEGFYQAITAMLVLGRYAEARSLLEEKNALEKGRGFRQDATHILLADTLIFQGKYEEARFHAQTGLALARRWGDILILGVGLIVRGWLALADGEYEAARKWFQEGAEHCQRHDLKEPLSWALAFLGFVQWKLGRLELAQTSFTHALQTAVEIESFVGTVFALVTGVPLIAGLHSGESAIECYTAVARYPTVANAKFFDDLIGQDVARLTAELPPEVAAQAKARGRARELDAVAAGVLAEGRGRG